MSSDGSINITFESRKHFLARGLYKVAGTDISDFLNDDSVEARLEFFDCFLKKGFFLCVN